jgi:hypothetical protein
VPLWARIAVPAVVIAGIASAVAVVVLQPRPGGPAEATEAACRSAALAELERHEMDVREFSFYDDGVTSTEEDVYLSRGEVAFQQRDGDESERRIRFRCTVRFEDGAMQAPSIRYSEPIAAE